MKIVEMGRRVEGWVIRTFGLQVFTNRHERGRRFLEEVVELNQALGVSKKEVLKIVRHVYSRPVGEVDQELGGVGVTLLAVFECLRKDFVEVTDVELRRIEALPSDYFRRRHIMKAEAGISVMPEETAA